MQGIRLVPIQETKPVGYPIEPPEGLHNLEKHRVFLCQMCFQPPYSLFDLLLRSSFRHALYPFQPALNYYLRKFFNITCQRLSDGKPEEV